MLSSASSMLLRTVKWKVCPGDPVQFEKKSRGATRHPLSALACFPRERSNDVPLFHCLEASVTLVVLAFVQTAQNMTWRTVVSTPSVWTLYTSARPFFTTNFFRKCFSKLQNFAVIQTSSQIAVFDRLVPQVFKSTPTANPSPGAPVDALTPTLSFLPCAAPSLAGFTFCVYAFISVKIFSCIFPRYFGGSQSEHNAQ